MGKPLPGVLVISIERESKCEEEMEKQGGKMDSRLNKLRERAVCSLICTKIYLSSKADNQPTVEDNHGQAKLMIVSTKGQRN